MSPPTGTSPRPTNSATTPERPSSVSHSESFESRWLGIVTVVLTLGGWTIVPILIKEFTGDVDAWTSNGWRYGFAALLWIPLLVWRRLRKAGKPGLFRAAMAPGLINACAQVCFTMSFYQIDPGLVAFGLRAQIVAVTLGAALMFPSERAVIRTLGFLVGLGLLLGGTLTTIGLSGEFGARSGTLGIVLAMMAGVGFAAYALAVRKCMTGYGSMASFAAISQYTAGAMVVLMLVLGERSGAGALDMTLPRFGLFLLSAIIGIAAGHVLYYISIEKLGVTVSSGVIQLQPFTVAALSFVWFGERLSPAQWLFGGVAVVGAITMIVVQHRVNQRLARAGRLAEGGGSRSEAEKDEAFADLPPDAVAAMAATHSGSEAVFAEDADGSDRGAEGPYDPP